MEDEKNAFYVVRKGDIIGIYKNLSDCQDQAGTSVCDPSVSVYKGYSLTTEAEDHLKSHGLRNALYTVLATDVKDDTFGRLIPCPFQQPSSSGGKQPQQLSSSRGTQPQQPCPSEGKQSEKVSPLKRTRNVGYMGVIELASPSLNPPGKVFKSENSVTPGKARNLLSCTLNFDGASKGNPGLAGAGAVLRIDDGSQVYRLREGVGIATNNVAEYRALILGLRYALEQGFRKIRVQGDSKLVCMQVQGLWKLKNQNMADLCKVANELKDKFTSFEINHVLREYNSEADAQANLALYLNDGQVEVDYDKKEYRF